MKIIAVCSLCGWESPSWFAPEFQDHLRDVHGLIFDPKPLARADEADD